MSDTPVPAAATPVLTRPSVRAGVLLALLAYVPALTSAPGRMPADSKLYLYLDPGRFLADAAGSFDPRQFAGWVPHQHIAYLWPAGPWFWLFDTIGVPDWVAHRLWVGTLMVAAGLGVRWCARLLGLSPVAALTAAVVYQLSLYVLPYVSRTSVMLLPWAGLGWIVAFTVRATRRRSWLDPAAIALVVFTVGAVNATALAMIVPGPVLWLVHAWWSRLCGWRSIAVVAMRTAGLSVAVSLWWMAMLVIQGRHGAEVLPYSESLADVSYTATSTEVWRGLGYWLFYIRDPAAATTTSSLRYLSSSPWIFASFVMPLVGLAGLTWVRWQHRRFAALLVGAGMVLAVGVHPIDDRSPLMRLLAGSDDGGLALALRSSTRAIPLLMLGLALAGGALVASLDAVRTGRTGPTWGRVAAPCIIVAAIVNMTGLWSVGVVDPALERDQDPPRAWTDAAAELDRRGDDARVLQLPGAEFGAYRWGYTVDQPLPGLTEKPLVTRDLLPLGSPAAMDLLYALDDRFQEGSIEPGSIAPVARLLGADTVWLTNDAAFDRFATARPEIVRDVVSSAPGIGEVTAFGDLFLNRPDVAVTDERSVGDPRVGAPIPPVEIASVQEPGSVVRARSSSVVLSGSGDGVVDAAAAGLITGDEAVLYSATFDQSDLQIQLARSAGLIVTDSNRDRAHHWRGSQDVVGFTESGGPEQDVLTDVASDQRLPVFERDDADSQTVSVQRGAVTARATSYGQPFAYLPEDRPSMAIDGRPDTAWIVGEHGNPIGERLRLAYAGSVGAIVLHQAGSVERRHISEISLEGVDTASGSALVTLDDSSFTAEGQTVPLAASGDGRFLDIGITAVQGGQPFTGGAAAGVGFTEVDLGLGPTVELIRPPHDALAALPAETALGLVFTRLHVDPTDRWRSDPEPVLAREFDLPTPRTPEVGVTVRVDQRASDAELATWFDWPVVASSRLTGSIRHAGVAAFDGSNDTSWITAFDGAAGARLSIAAVAEPVTAITVGQPVAGFSAITELTLTSGTDTRVVSLRPDAGGVATVAVDPPLPAGPLDLTVSGVDARTTVDRRFADVVELPVAVNEITIAGGPVVAPLDTLVFSAGCVPVFDVDGRPVGVTLSVDGPGWLDGDAIGAAPCESTVVLSAGTHTVTAPRIGPFQLDQIVLLQPSLTADAGPVTVGQSASAAPLPATATVTERSRFGRTIDVRDCTGGCWVVMGEGWNPAWSATSNGVDLGRPTPVDGGFNGWWIQPVDGTATIDVHWTAQRGLTLAMLASLLGVFVAAGLVLWERRRAPATIGTTSSAPAAERATLELTVITLGPVRAVMTGVLWCLAGYLLAGPWWGLAGALAGVAIWVSRRGRIPELTALVTVGVLGVAITAIERADAPVPTGGWPAHFERFHQLGMFAVAAVVVGALVADDAGSRPPRPDRAKPESDRAEPERVGVPGAP